MSLRVATAQDAPLIIGLMQAAWPDDTADASAIASLVESGEHFTLLAEAGGCAAGFCDAFATVGPNRETRWEIDLLAVHRDFRGRGLATTLVAASTAEGRRRGMALARGLVRADNQPARRAFAAAGYIASPELRRLYVAPVDAVSVSLPPDAAGLVDVRTFAYSGVWLEGEISAEALAAVVERCGERGGQIAGAVISAADMTAIEAAERLGMERVGVYHWWTQMLTAGAAPAPR